MKKQPLELIDRIGASVTEAWTNVDHYEEPAHISIPNEAAVAETRDWNEEHIQ